MTTLQFALMLLTLATCVILIRRATDELVLTLLALPLVLLGNGSRKIPRKLLL